MNEPIEDAWSVKGAKEWRKAANSEYQSLENMKIWGSVEPPANVDIVPEGFYTIPIENRSMNILHLYVLCNSFVCFLTVVVFNCGWLTDIP